MKSQTYAKRGDLFICAEVWEYPLSRSDLMGLKRSCEAQKTVIAALDKTAEISRVDANIAKIAAALAQ